MLSEMSSSKSSKVKQGNIWFRVGLHCCYYRSKYQRINFYINKADGDSKDADLPEGWST